MELLLTGWADKGGGGKGSHGNTSLLISPEIGECTTNEGHGSREGNTVDGTADEKSLDVLGDGTGDDEDDGNEESRCAKIQLTPTTLLSVDIERTY